ncbi:hypothetical protein NLJ89_g9916 [Agrocybe chaxingu]|uniref:Protein kinase domain-containing protein n=1 Tax=Agrocybe chaxingu TaxID=84603 RepID=A0A9W8JV22_9AGAR|nr:hypothetical protein NLJ89_g9916 [Agrocybe chaxingu]
MFSTDDEESELSTLLKKYLPEDYVPVPEGGLTSSEKFWCKHYQYLQDHGYQLRPRYAPGWVHSWKDTDKFYLDCEDGACLRRSHVIDAIHIPTGSAVAIKQLSKEIGPDEEAIMRYFSSEPLASHPHNHCIPLLDAFPVPDDDAEQFLVVPLLHSFDSPVFDTFGEAVECIRQLFEGLQFLHKHNVAHRDLNANNFMMETNSMYPKGYHPQEPLYEPDMIGFAKPFTRTQCPQKYFIIDYGHARQYDLNDPNPRDTKKYGGDISVPEYENDRGGTHDPFATDVYYVGNLVRTHFIEGHPLLPSVRGYDGFEFLLPLIDDMTQADPRRRPRIDEAVERMDQIIAGLSEWKLRSRTSSRSTNIFETVSHIFWHWARKIAFIYNGTPALPRPSH